MNKKTQVKGIYNLVQWREKELKRVDQEIKNLEDKRKLLTSKYSKKGIARLYDVNPSKVSKISTGENWSNLTGKLYV